ncbi:hypothetical protein EDB81DRAFT_756504 [Dactylonectria macrodidyma]|uniref:Pectate lyase superfamily protein domain-containing protein n=1 Tax=Dactylonectria macrodidyma TaxID=307937 RepID=A0A9P9JDF4_9HYPO|nr:hypothetical protein EDB81DRAFT_756504 [Dactylonectria macrodidyma]
MLSPTPFTIIAIFLCYWAAQSVINHRRSGEKQNETDWASIVDSRGNRFPDFSYCGYHNSDIPTPSNDYFNVSVSVPWRSMGDMTPLIQEAIDNVAQRGGGLVKLPRGKMTITAGIQLRSNVVVTGFGKIGTTLVLEKKPTKPVFALGNLDLAPKAEFGIKSNITNEYVPIGSSVVTVNDSAGFAVNQSVYICRDATESWVRANGMSDLVRDGVAQTWIPAGKKIMSPNKIESIDGNHITLKIPLADALDSAYMKPQVWAYMPPVVASEMGVENLRIEIPNTCSGTPLDDTSCNSAAVSFSSWTVDSWASGLTLVGFNKFFEVQRDASRITIQNSTMTRDRDIEGVAIPADISISGSQVLVQDCTQAGLETARTFSVTTDSLTPGPNTVTRHKTRSSVQTIFPHQRWAQGLLVEGSLVPTLFVNRDTKGTGQGWTINAGVGWNLGGYVDFESPPLGINWCVGCGGTNVTTGNATFISPSRQVMPRSLFAAQLQARGVHWNATVSETSRDVEG